MWRSRQTTRLPLPTTTNAKLRIETDETETGIVTETIMQPVVAEEMIAEIRTVLETIVIVDEMIGTARMTEKEIGTGKEIGIENAIGTANLNPLVTEIATTNEETHMIRDPRSHAHHQLTVMVSEGHQEEHTDTAEEVAMGFHGVVAATVDVEAIEDIRSIKIYININTRTIIKTKTGIELRAGFTIQRGITILA